MSTITNLKCHSLACAVSKEILVWDTCLVDEWILFCCFQVNARIGKTTLQVNAITRVRLGLLLKHLKLFFF